MQEHDTQTKCHNRLDDALAQLDPQSRQIMELWLQGATNDDMACQLGLPERAVEVIRTRTLWQVRDFIARQAPL